MKCRVQNWRKTPTYQTKKTTFHTMSSVARSNKTPEPTETGEEVPTKTLFDDARELFQKALLNEEPEYITYQKFEALLKELKFLDQIYIC